MLQVHIVRGCVKWTQLVLDWQLGIDSTLAYDNIILISKNDSFSNGLDTADSAKPIEINRMWGLNFNYACLCPVFS